MTYPKYNQDKYLNIKAGQYHDNQKVSNELNKILTEEQKNEEIKELGAEITKYYKERQEYVDNISRRQKYLNESNWYALKSYITKLAVIQAKSLYDFNIIKEEMGVDPEEIIAQEVEQELKVEIPLEIQGEMGTIIPIKIEVTPETADVVNTVVGIMNTNNTNDKIYMSPEQVEASADEAMNEVDVDSPEIETATDAISDDVVDIISKDQQILHGIKAKMDELDLRVAGTEEILSQAGEIPYEKPIIAPTPEEEDLEQDPETGLLINTKTGEIIDPETGQVIEEEFHREHRIQTILEALAVKKATEAIQENHNGYNRNAAIINGLNNLIVRKSMDHVFGRKVSYQELKTELKIK